VSEQPRRMFDGPSADRRYPGRRLGLAVRMP
jgi:hypothetical protein